MSVKQTLKELGLVAEGEMLADPYVNIVDKIIVQTGCQFAKGKLGCHDEENDGSVGRWLAGG